MPEIDTERLGQWQDLAAFVFLASTAVRSTASGHHGPALETRGRQGPAPGSLSLPGCTSGS